MENINQHIESYLKYYLSTDNPGFAVLIRGKWGSGKTWFVKNYFSMFNQQWSALTSRQEQTSVYVSLNGVKSTEEIDKRIFLSLHPKLDKKYTLLFAHLISGVLKAKGFHTIIEDFKMNDFIKTVQGKQVIIFDDLERCAIPIEESLGYINEFVEHMGLRVIIIANEEDIVVKHPKGSNVQYELIQEKLIGKRFQVAHDSLDIMDHFIHQIQNQSAKSFVQSQRDIIASVYGESGTENLRILLHGLRDFDRLFSKLGVRLVKDKALLERIVQVFFSFHFDINIGRISPKDVISTQTYRWRHFLKSEKNSEPLPIESTMGRYSCLKDQNLALSAEAWKDWFEKGYISDEIVLESLAQNGFIKKKEPEWVKLWHWMKSDDASLATTIEQVKSSLRKGKFTHPAVIAHISGTFLTLSKSGIHPEDLTKIVEYFKKYVDELGNRLDFIDPSAFEHEVEAWAGLGYQSNDTPEFQQIFSHIVAALSNREAENLGSLAPKLLKLMEKDSMAFWKRMMASSGKESLYNKPIFAFVTPKAFFESLLLVPNTNKPDVFYMFKERYVHARTFTALQREFDFVIQVNDLVNQYLSENPGKVSSHMLSVGQKKYLSEALQTIEEIRNPPPKKDE